MRRGDSSQDQGRGTSPASGVKAYRFDHAEEAEHFQVAVQALGAYAETGAEPELIEVTAPAGTEAAIAEEAARYGGWEES